MVERGELVHVIPDSSDARMEDVRTIAMDIDPIPLLAVQVPADMVPLLQDQHPLVRPAGLVREHRAEQSRPDNHKVVTH